MAPGSERGNEVMAHVAAQLDQPMAANCVSLSPGNPATVVRVRWGGSLLEEARLHGSPLLVTTAPHAVAAAAALDAETVRAAQTTRAVAVTETRDHDHVGRLAHRRGRRRLGRARRRLGGRLRR